MRKKRLLRIALFLCVLLLPLEAESMDESIIRRVRIVECHNSPSAQLLLVWMGRTMGGLADDLPVWQTLQAGTEEEHEALNRASVIGIYDILFTGSEEHVRNLELQQLLRGTCPLFEERLILVGPPDKASEMKDLGILDMMKKIAAEEYLFFNQYKISWIDEAARSLFSQAESPPDGNRQFVEIGREHVDALMQAGDEGAFILAGEATFAQYHDLQRDEEKLVKLRDTGISRTSYVCLMANAGFRRERTATADKYFEWLASEEAKRTIEEFEIGGIRPFKAVRRSALEKLPGSR